MLLTENLPLDKDEQGWILLARVRSSRVFPLGGLDSNVMGKFLHLPSASLNFCPLGRSALLHCRGVEEGNDEKTLWELSVTGVLWGILTPAASSLPERWDWWEECFSRAAILPCVTPQRLSKSVSDVKDMETSRPLILSLLSASITDLKAPGDTTASFSCQQGFLSSQSDPISNQSSTFLNVTCSATLNTF